MKPSTVFNLIFILWRTVRNQAVKVEMPWWQANWLAQDNAIPFFFVTHKYSYYQTASVSCLHLWNMLRTLSYFRTMKSEYSYHRAVYTSSYFRTITHQAFVERLKANIVIIEQYIHIWNNIRTLSYFRTLLISKWI